MDTGPNWIEWVKFKIKYIKNIINSNITRNLTITRNINII